MSKRRSSERGAGETSGRAGKLQCPGISGNNAKRAGPFILGKETTTYYILWFGHSTEIRDLAGIAPIVPFCVPVYL